MATLQSEIREKRNILRDLYGGTMTLGELTRELGMNHHDAKRWGMEQGLGILIGHRIKYDTDAVAKRIVQLRGMC